MYETLSVIFSLVVFGAMLWVLGWRGQSYMKTPPLPRKLPLVSIFIPAYKSEKIIEEAFKSVKAIDYPRKEVFVVNDYPDKTPRIAKKYGFTVIQGKERQGKCHALNAAVKKARGEILFFMDADTIVSKNCLKEIVPWFSDKEIGAVSPRCRVKNKRHNLLTRMTAIEHSFLNRVFKIQMFMGSLISFWGFGIAIKTDVFRKMGGWSDTLLEDAEFAGKLVRAGYKIQYAPTAYASTLEPVSRAELRSQRIRWGKGSMYSFLRHRTSYKTNPQFLIYFLPYIIMAFAILAFVGIETAVFALNLTHLSFGMIFPTVYFFFWLFFTMLFAAAAGAILHMLIIVTTETDRKRELALTIPFVCLFTPFIMAYYVKGMIYAIRDKRKKKKELDFKHW